MRKAIICVASLCMGIALFAVFLGLVWISSLFPELTSVAVGVLLVGFFAAVSYAVLTK